MLCFLLFSWVQLANLYQAPDIPGIPPGAEDEGDNYLAFLVVLKNLIGGRSVSIAAPASYWYLKGFPIKEISKVVDYIIYMTYDLHGQVWSDIYDAAFWRLEILITFLFP